MRQKGNNMFNWPMTEDCALYRLEAISALINIPKKRTKGTPLQLGQK
jgi:hypothetical protein